MQLRSKCEWKVRAPSCTPCRNGPTCKYLARGVCWFAHDEIERGAAGCNDSDVAKFVVDAEGKLSSLSSKIQKDMSVLEEMGVKVKALEGKVSRSCAETEARTTNLARSCEKDAADAQCKLDDLADAVVNLELTMQENVEIMRADLLKYMSDKLDSQWLRTKREFEVEQDCKVDAKLDDSLNGIRSLIAATVEMVSKKIGDKIRHLEERLNKWPHSDKG